jgi:uncharacterized protein (TIGR02246 family)
MPRGIRTISMTVGVLLVMPVFVVGADREAEVRKTVQAFYLAFDEGFVKPVDFATPDWHHINPLGGVDRGLDAVLKTVRTVHATFLKGTTDTIDEMTVRFASDTVAVATVVSTMSPFTAPDGVKHGSERHIRTFVVVQRGERWLIMQDQNTTVSGP